MTDEASTTGKAALGAITEHLQIEALLRRAEAACEAEQLAEARLAAARLSDGVEAHFQREERLYFPIISGLRLEHRRALDHLVAAHDVLRRRLDELGARLVAGDVAGGGRALLRLAARFADHEAEEEAFLDALDADLERSP